MCACPNPRWLIDGNPERNVPHTTGMLNRPGRSPPRPFPCAGTSGFPRDAPGVSGPSARHSLSPGRMNTPSTPITKSRPSKTKSVPLRFLLLFSSEYLMILWKISACPGKFPGQNPTSKRSSGFLGGHLEALFRSDAHRMS
ncbi:hypothetical protein Sfum_0882 [Syntrophobacter fumaroxidans MPOB]|uniref:Uncharacterized protein n=1 Tax=Syntrophobacter fumaroxidans (strain DSM 10017 / MPOB) TaxID=335543 RepID=A0LGM7_SYNFM|nr:hypothetical protein Sfum_0882 [Syntrophobacter fumaroxidans MPOB]